jgi:hypothetical protein
VRYGAPIRAVSREIQVVTIDEIDVKGPTGSPREVLQTRQRNRGPASSKSGRAALQGYRHGKDAAVAPRLLSVGRRSQRPDGRDRGFANPLAADPIITPWIAFSSEPQRHMWNTK